MSKEITKDELREILAKKDSGIILSIYNYMFDTKTELINDLIGNHSEKKITAGLKWYGLDFEVVSKKKGGNTNE